MRLRLFEPCLYGIDICYLTGLINLHHNSGGESIYGEKFADENFQVSYPLIQSCTKMNSPDENFLEFNYS